jgi:hypothetical protein
MKLIELILDEESMLNGIDAISIVENPAIEENFVALSKAQAVKLATQNEEKRILMGPALIPNKRIYRRDGDDEYEVFFSEATVRRCMELFFIRGNQNNSTIEHMSKLHGLTVVESWIIEDSEKDKSALYGLSYPVGTWMISQKVENQGVWDDYVKTGMVKGFSIEGYFADKVKMSEMLQDIDEEEGQFLLSSIKQALLGKKVEMESYSDYPESVRNNAKRGIELNDKVNNRCATQVGKVRAQQLANGEAVSVETIKRMYSYLSRAEVYYDQGTPEDCGYISYLLWGGKTAKSWAESKLKSLDQMK